MYRKGITNISDFCDIKDGLIWLIQICLLSGVSSFWLFKRRISFCYDPALYLQMYCNINMKGLNILKLPHFAIGLTWTQPETQHSVIVIFLLVSPAINRGSVVYLFPLIFSTYITLFNAEIFNSFKDWSLNAFVLSRQSYYTLNCNNSKQCQSCAFFCWL